MRRWFIAVFTLHFFLSVGAFAFGQTDIHTPSGDHPPTPLEAWADGPHPAQDDDLMGSAPDHGLTDSQPDLPDIIKPVSAALGTSPLQPAPPGHRWVPLLSPTLEGLQRPPRDLAARG